MQLKVYKSGKESQPVSGENQEQNNSQQESFFYETPKLLRRNGVYYIGYEESMVEIQDWEAQAVYEHPETVYDVIISHTRKYYFNTAEDSPRSMFE